MSSSFYAFTHYTNLLNEPFIDICSGQENMATYKVPQIRLIDEFPLTTTGKVKKEVLKKEFLNLG